MCVCAPVSMCVHIRMSCMSISCEPVSGHSWYKCAGCQQVGLCASCMWVVAIVPRKGLLSIFPFLGVGVYLWRNRGEGEQGEGRVGISGSWELEKKTVSMIESALDGSRAL